MHPGENDGCGDSSPSSDWLGKAALAP